MDSSGRSDTLPPPEKDKDDTVSTPSTAPTAAEPPPTAIETATEPAVGPTAEAAATPTPPITPVAPPAIDTSTSTTTTSAPVSTSEPKEPTAISASKVTPPADTTTAVSPERSLDTGLVPDVVEEPPLLSIVPSRHEDLTLDTHDTTTTTPPRRIFTTSSALPRSLPAPTRVRFETTTTTSPSKPHRERSSFKTTRKEFEDDDDDDDDNSDDSNSDDSDFGRLDTLTSSVPKETNFYKFTKRKHDDKTDDSSENDSNSDDDDNDSEDNSFFSSSSFSEDGDMYDFNKMMKQLSNLVVVQGPIFLLLFLAGTSILYGDIRGFILISMIILFIIIGFITMQAVDFVCRYFFQPRVLRADESISCLSVVFGNYSLGQKLNLSVFIYAFVMVYMLACADSQYYDSDQMFPRFTTFLVFFVILIIVSISLSVGGYCTTGIMMDGGKSTSSSSSSYASSSSTDTFSGDAAPITWGYTMTLLYYNITTLIIACFMGWAAAAIIIAVGSPELIYFSPNEGYDGCRRSSKTEYKCEITTQS